MSRQRRFPKPGPESAIKELDRQIATHEQTLAEIDEARAEHLGLLRSLRSARATLARKSEPTTRTPAVSRGVRTAEQRAGSGNVEAARKVLAKARRLAKPEIGRRMAALRGTAINDGTVTYAIKALVDKGDAVEVGVVDGSRVYEYVSRHTSTVSRPGDR